MQLFLAILVIGIAVLGMSIGVIFNRKPLQGSCGGVANDCICLKGGTCDDPSQKPLYELFSKLASENGALLLIGDSVMQQFFGALGCELEREGIWNDPKSFKNTDEIRFVNPNLLERGGHSSGEKLEDRSVPIKFVPIYHFVDGIFIMFW